MIRTSFRRLNIAQAALVGLTLFVVAPTAIFAQPPRFRTDWPWLDNASPDAVKEFDRLTNERHSNAPFIRQLMSYYYQSELSLRMADYWAAKSKEAGLDAVTIADFSRRSFVAASSCETLALTARNNLIKRYGGQYKDPTFSPLLPDIDRQLDQLIAKAKDIKPADPAAKESARLAAELNVQIMERNRLRDEFNQVTKRHQEDIRIIREQLLNKPNDAAANTKALDQLLARMSDLFERQSALESRFTELDVNSQINQLATQLGRHEAQITQLTEQLAKHEGRLKSLERATSVNPAPIECFPPYPFIIIPCCPQIITCYPPVMVSQRARLFRCFR